MRLTAIKTQKLDFIKSSQKKAGHNTGVRMEAWAVIEEGETFEFERSLVNKDLYKFYKNCYFDRKGRQAYENRLAGTLPASVAEEFIELCKEISE